MKKNIKIIFAIIIIIVIFLQCSERNTFQNEDFYKDDKNFKSFVGDNVQMLDTTKIYLYFSIVDVYLDDCKYDSAQVYLAKINKIIPVNNISLFKYFLLSRQSEIYYYNNLHQLGLMESKKALSVAQALNDSILLADSHNFLGLFYNNLNSLDEALSSYFEGIKYAKRVVYPAAYIPLSKPHHLDGNIAEVYFHLGRYEDAWNYYLSSLQKATDINQLRGMAVASAGLGDICYINNKYDNAITYYRNSKSYALKSKNYDVALICYSGIAKCEWAKSNIAGTNQNLNLGYQLIKNQADVNKYYILLFLDEAIKINKKMGKADNLILAFDKVITNNIFNGTGMYGHIEDILNSGIIYENKLLQLQISNEKSKKLLAYTFLFIALTIVLLLITWLLLYRVRYKQKVQMAEIKQTISKDLHDELGLGLTSANYLLYNILKINANKETKNEIKRVIGLNTMMVSQMRDIIWSMDESKDNILEFAGDINAFFKEFLSDHQLHGQFLHSNDDIEIKINGFIRRNLLMCLKECLNNAVKHGEPTLIKVNLYWTKNQVSLHVQDNGSGFTEKSTSGPLTGNGLKNINKRVKDCSGKVSFYNEDGANVQIEIPIHLQ